MSGRHGRPAVSVAVATLVLAASGSAHPLTIDSFIQQGGKLIGGGASGSGFFGDSVALSADGNTALIGGASDANAKGAAWVFTRTSSGWSQQGGKLTGSDESGTGGFGQTVALSADGSTALIGGPNDNGNKGAAWVFIRSGSVWYPQGGKLTGSGEISEGGFGSTVALSGDGATALIGGYSDDDGRGAVWVYTRSGMTWSQQGGKLIDSDVSADSSFGAAVALSASGNIALIGGYYDNNQTGAAWVFKRSPLKLFPGRFGWSQVGGKLTGDGESGTGRFGSAVALSGDGTTALIGGSYDNDETGAAWVFTRSGSAWNQEGGKLTGSGESGIGEFGQAVALSGDGGVALVGGAFDGNTRGAAWVFTRSGSAWSQQGNKLTGGGEIGGANFGGALALSGGGDTALIGAENDDSGTGAAWSFAILPVVSALNPASGSTGGGTNVTISGSDLSGATAVKFGATAAASFTVVSATKIRTVSPRGAVGAVDVTVTTPKGTSPIGAPDRFTYLKPAATTTTATTSTTATTTATTVTTSGDHTPPRLTSLTVRPASFTATHRTTIHYRLSEPATVTLSFRRCLKLGAGKGKPCRRYGKPVALRAHGKQGANSLRFNGRIRATRLHPGRYRLTATATDAAKNHSRTSPSAGFTLKS